MKIKKLVAFLLFFSLTMATFANGQQDSSKVTVTGTVVSMVPADNGQIAVTVNSDGKTYTVNISKEEQTALKLAVGKDIIVNGSVLNDNNPDGIVELEASDLEDIESGDKVSVGDSTVEMKDKPEPKEKKEAPDKPDSDSDSDSGSDSDD